MKKRLLAMLLAMLMVMGTLPMAAFADEPEQAGSTPETTATVTDIAEKGMVAEKDGAKVVLANYNLSAPESPAPWDDVSLTIDSVTPADANNPKTVKLTLSVTNLKEHKNASNADGKWIGIGVPFAVVGTDTKNYEDGSAYYWGLGPRPSDYLTKGYGNSTTPGYIAGGWSTSQQVTVDGDKYISRYWNLAALTADDESKGYIVAKDPNIISGVITGWTYTVYEVTFKVLLGDADVLAGGETGRTKTDADGVHKYTATEGTITLSLQPSGSDGIHTSGVHGYYTKMTLPTIPTGSYVILSRGDNNTDAALKNALNKKTGSQTYPYDVDLPAGLAKWMEVYDKATWDATNAPYWTEISRQPVVNVTVATPMGDDGYTYEKYQFDFSNVKLALPFTVSSAVDSDLTGFGTVANFQDEVKSETTEVSATIADRKIAVTGTSNWVDCPAFGTDRTAANYVALKLAAKDGAPAISKVKVTMSDGTTTKEFPATDALLWQFNEVGSNKEIAIRVYFASNGSVAYILDCSGMTLKNAEDAAEDAEVPTVVPAPIADHGTPAKPANELGTVAVSTPVAVAGEANTYSLTLTGTDIVKHENANGDEGYWVGFGMPVENGKIYKYVSVGTNGAETTIVDASSRTCTVDGKTYNTVYFDTEGVYTIKQSGAVDETIPTVTYKVKVVINKKATAYEENTLEPANLTATADGTAPEYGHVQDYDVTNKGNTITIMAHGLEKTTAADDAGKAYWFGVALPKVAGRTYATGFDTMPATVADSAYKTLTTEQTVGDKTYVTTYWGVGSPAGIENRKTGWLSVKDADGAVINYVVNFDITVADGDVYTAANAPVPANLTDWTAEPYKPAGAHATEYGVKVDQASKTITITAKGLEKTINANGTEAYWVGVALPEQVNYTYATGFGEMPAKNAKNKAETEYLVKYEALTTKQTVEGKTYVTTYWGWNTADKAVNAQDGWLSVMDDNGRIVDYTVKFVITPAAPTVVKAPIVDQSDPSRPESELGSVVVTDFKAVDGKTLTYSFKLTGIDIPYHENANGDVGTWVGFGMPIEGAGGTGYTYTLKAATADDEDTVLGSVPGRVITVGGKNYNTVYFSENGTYTIEQTKGDTTITYIVTVKITVAEGDTYGENDLKPANLTYVEGEDAPAYGHADAYEVTNDGTKITVKAENLKKTANAQEPPVTAYWIGVGVPYAEGAKYAWYFKGTEEPNTAYRTVDRTQDVDGHAYTTLYWGWETVEEMAELKTATLSVMDKDGKITTYDVTFDVTVTGTVSAVPGENGKVVVDESVIAGLIEAAMNAGNDIVDDAGTSQAPVATIVAANDSDDPDAAPLTEASVDVSVATLKAAQAGEVSVALEVEGVGSITLDPAAIGAIVEDLEDTDKLTLEVAKVNADTLTHTPADIKAEALVSFTASVLDENKEAVPVSGTITLTFKTELTTKQDSDIDVYQDGAKVSSFHISGGTLTLTVNHLSEFVVVAKDEKQDPPTPPDTPSIPNIPSVPSGNTYSVSNGSGSADNGSWSTDKTSAAEGDTVTITVTPAEGYRATVTVKDAQGNKVTVTKAEDGKYTFTMPKSKVDVSVSFAELIVFTDVKDDAYYADAVAWAVANGITNGVGNNKFAPKLGCTRADIVTFLWRAMGSPEVDTTVEFTDVEAGSYYEKAVAWAVANDITNGIGDGKFAPKQVCTRAQIVTFLWRTAKSPEVSDSESGFNDVRADAYYADAVAWAVANEITNGTGNNNFSPKAPCTRADIVTFLYRYMA